MKHFRRSWGRSLDGTKAFCSDCQRAYEEMWRAKNKDRLRAARGKRRIQDALWRHKYIRAHRAEYLISGTRSRCIKKGLAFDLDQHIEELNVRLNYGICELTGLQFRMDVIKRDWDSPSIDRINPSLGYIYSNVRVVCLGMNAALGNWGEKAFRKIACAYLERNP